VETCPVGQRIFKIQKHTPCPGLKFEGDLAACYAFASIIEDAEKRSIDIEDETKTLFGIGAGCCISARCFKDGVQYDFASLSKEVKISIVRKLR